MPPMLSLPTSQYVRASAPVKPIPPGTLSSSLAM